MKCSCIVIIIYLWCYVKGDAPYPPSIQSIQNQPNNNIPPSHQEEIPFTSSADGTDLQHYSSNQAIENPSYDPSVYQNFAPHDAVQQYVNSYGGPYAPANGAMGYGGYGGPIPYGGYPPNPAGFSVQTGYEGFLVPSIPPIPPPSYNVGLYKTLSPYIGSVGGVIARSGSALLSAIGIVLFGGALTTAICTLTPLCTITFAALPLLGLRATAKTIQEKIETEITPERVKRAAEFVKIALDKYSKLDQNVNVKNEEKKSDNK